MAFETNNFNVAKKYCLAKSEFSVECNVSAGENVAKVLSVSLASHLSSSETLNGVINYSGVIDTKLVFLSEDGQLNTVCSTCPFSSKFESENIENGCFAEIKLKIIDYNIDGINGENIKIIVSVEQSGFIVCNKEVRSIRNNDDDVCLKNDEIKVVRFIGHASESIEIASEINIRDKVKKIILSESNVLVKSVESGVNFVTMSGEVSTRVIFLNDNDKFESGYVYDTFKEELEIEGTTRDSLVEGRGEVKQENVTAEIVEDEKGCKIAIKVPIELHATAYSEESLMVVQDLYSTKSDIKVTTESFDNSYVCPMEVVEGKIEGSLVLDEDKPRVDKILFSGGNSVTVTNSYINDGEIFIEGIAKTTVVYLNDEDNALYSAQIDVPFTISDKFSCPEGGILVVDAIADDVDVAVKKGRELFYDAKVKACVNCCYNKLSAVITEAVETEEYPPRDYAMEVVFARAGQELWEIAKSVKVKEEQIVTQNADVTFPLADDTSLILFYQRI